MKTKTITKQHCVITAMGMTEDDVLFEEVVEKAIKVAKSLEMKSLDRDGLKFKKQVVSIVENKDKNEVYINYEEVEDAFLNNLTIN